LLSQAQMAAPSITEWLTLLSHLMSSHVFLALLLQGFSHFTCGLSKINTQPSSFAKKEEVMNNSEMLRHMISEFTEISRVF
jgi:hypothetical protein